MIDSTTGSAESPHGIQTKTEADEFFKSSLFYTNAQKYWSEIAPTVDGMLGGLGCIAPADIQFSSQFLNDLYKMNPSPGKSRALDCGAGIGRVTKHLLTKVFECVDLVEQDERFVAIAKDYLSINGALSKKIGTIFNEGLQHFVPDAHVYDIIWCQWVLGHLSDDDLIAFFKRCIQGLSPNGCIILKENVTVNGDFCIDNVDSSVTRSLKRIKFILESANLRVIKIIKQQHVIDGLFPIYTIACRPIKQKNFN